MKFSSTEASLLRRKDVSIISSLELKLQIEVSTNQRISLCFRRTCAITLKKSLTCWVEPFIFIWLLSATYTRKRLNLERPNFSTAQKQNFGTFHCRMTYTQAMENYNAMLTTANISPVQLGFLFSIRMKLPAKYVTLKSSH